MEFSWSPHRFSGGALAFDVANTVIMRHDPALATDRFAERGRLAGFASAAQQHCAERERLAGLRVVDAMAGRQLLALREAIDRHFRAMANGMASGQTLAGLLLVVARTIGNCGRDSLECATALSALKLAGDPPQGRVKTCRNCGWLLLDRSKNKSRIWCDMMVCGNRQKARRHYRRKQMEPLR